MPDLDRIVGGLRCREVLELLADFVDVVVHLFEPNARAYYDLESMWSDAPRLDPAPPADGARGN